MKRKRVCPAPIWRQPARNGPEAALRVTEVGPNTAFVVLIFGLLSLYAEIVWPGRLIPGILGMAVLLTGAYFLFRGPLNAAGVALLVLAIGLLAAEALWGPYFLLGSLGAIALTAGFYLLLEPPRRIVPVLSVPVSLVFGALTVLLAAGAKRARRNKWSDLTVGK